jgi:hypothetical protein
MNMLMPVVRLLAIQILNLHKTPLSVLCANDIDLSLSVKMTCTEVNNF